MVPDTSLLNTQQYTVHIEGKVEQSRERSSALPILGVVAIEKGTFWLLSTTVANFTFLLMRYLIAEFYFCVMFDCYQSLYFNIL